MQLHSVNVNNIVIPPNRQRQEFLPESIAELAGSISQNGLINPITARREGGTTLLVAGERRIKALLYLWQFGETLRCGGVEFAEGQVPVLYTHELSPLLAELMEYEENIRRVDLTWQERAKSTRRIAEIQGELSRAAGKPAPTIAELSEEVRGSSASGAQDDTRKELIVARFLGDEEVAKAKNVDEAFKILKRKEAAQKNVELAAQVGKTFSAADHRLENIDSIIWLSNPSLSPSENYDIILTDPPYGMGADEFDDSGGMTGGAHNYTDSHEYWVKTLSALCPQLFRVAKPQAHAYLFCDLDNFHELRALMQSAGWKPFRTPLVWHKPGGMRAPWPMSGPLRRYELILYAVKGDKPVTRLYPGVVSYPSDDNLGHTAQKPVALFLDLLRRSAKPGDSVLDPFAGSGTIFPACHEMKCRATGIEIDPASYGLAAKRLGGLK